MANLKVHAGAIGDVQLLESATSPENVTPPELLPRLIDVVRQVRQPLSTVPLDEIVKLSMEVPPDRIQAISDAMAGPDRSTETLKKFGVVWKEIRCSDAEIRDLRHRLKKGDDAVVADVYKDIVNAVESMASRAAELNLPLRCS